MFFLSPWFFAYAYLPGEGYALGLCQKISPTGPDLSQLRILRGGGSQCQAPFVDTESFLLGVVVRGRTVGVLVYKPPS